MVEVKRGRGRPRKNPIGVFELEAVKRPVGRPRKKKLGRPKGSKNKPKMGSETRTVEQRLSVLELAMIVVVEAVNTLSALHTKKKTK